MCHVFVGLLLVAVSLSASDGYKRYSSISRWYKSEVNCMAFCNYAGKACVQEGSRWCCKKAGSCKTPPALEHGEVYTPCGTGHGRMAAYLCEKGYELSGPDLRTCESGEWSGPEPVCLRDCGELEDPANGDVILNGTLEGDTATYTCDRGYAPIAETSPRICVSGSWSGLPVECSPVACPDPIGPFDGFFEYSPPLVFEMLGCATGYELNGPNRRICLSNGSLSGSDPICEPIDCGQPDPVCNGNVSAPSTLYNGTASYSCDPEYNLVGSSTRTCISSGWSGDPPCCVEDTEPLITCRTLSDPIFGDVDMYGNVEGSVAKYECIDCFEVTNESNVVCQSDGNWSRDVTLCTGPIEEYSGLTYLYIMCKRNWHDAKSICEEFNGNLVKIPDNATQNYIKDAITFYGVTGEDWWTGLNDESTENDFRWRDGTSDAGYDNWGGSQPDNADGDQDCVRLSVSQFNWWDEDCSKQYFFICSMTLPF